jgi:hypothetical protein
LMEPSDSRLIASRPLSEERNAPGAEDWGGFTALLALKPSCASRPAQFGAVPKTHTIAATFAVSFAGSVTVGD